MYIILMCLKLPPNYITSKYYHYFSEQCLSFCSANRNIAPIFSVCCAIPSVIFQSAKSVIIPPASDLSVDLLKSLHSAWLALSGSSSFCTLFYHRAFAHGILVFPLPGMLLPQLCLINFGFILQNPAQPSIAFLEKLPLTSLTLSHLQFSIVCMILFFSW